MKNVVVKLIVGEVKLSKKDVENLIEVPPKGEMGDFAFPCFGLAKSLRKSPLIIAEELAGKFRKKLPKEISGVDFKGGYVNFFVDKKMLAKNVLARDNRKLRIEDRGRIVIDMSSPNIAKPFGIGHLRSTIIGNSIGRIAEANGFEVVKINYLGDWGTQFGKIIFGFRKWGSESELKKNPVEHLYELYVRANDKEFEDEAREEFRKLESGNVENVKSWEKFRKLSLKEFDEIYNLLVVDTDPKVREIAEKSWQERRQRIWMQEYLDVVLSVKNGSNDEFAKAWRYGDALRQIGDDEALWILRRYLRTHKLPPNVRFWISELIKEIEKEWQKVTQKWPEPWYSWEGVIEDGKGKAHLKDGNIVDVNYSVSYKLASEPSEKHNWEGVFWPIPQLATLKYLEFENGQKKKIFITKSMASGVAVFQGNDKLPFKN